MLAELRIAFTVSAVFVRVSFAIRILVRTVNRVYDFMLILFFNFNFNLILIQF